MVNYKYEIRNKNNRPQRGHNGKGKTMTKQTKTPRHIVMTAAANMPSSCRGSYGRVAVVRLEDGFDGIPKMISDRARGVAEIVETWEKCSIGKTEKSAFAIAKKEAESMCAELNAKRK